MVSSEEFITCIASFQSQRGTDEFLKVSMDCTVLELTRKDFEMAIARFPQLKAFNEKVLVRIVTQCQQRIVNLTTKSKKDYYDELLQSNPAMLQNMNQYELASYLGMEPESLSRLRKKK
jgi:CRP/FNR family transcriptional regulator, anaerobic regulatory protein